MKPKIFDDMKAVPFPGFAAIQKRFEDQQQLINNQQHRLDDQQRQIDRLHTIVSGMSANAGRREKHCESVSNGASTPLKKIRDGIATNTTGPDGNENP